MSHALTEEEVPDASGKNATRTVMKFHPAMAPVKAAVLPLVRNKAELTERARKIYDDFKIHFQCQYDDRDTIGRRYRRQDAIGTPYCITVDFETIEEDQKVTLRDRDTLEQKRITVQEAFDIIAKETNETALLEWVDDHHTFPGRSIGRIRNSRSGKWSHHPTMGRKSVGFSKI